MPSWWQPYQERAMLDAGVLPAACFMLLAAASSMDRPLPDLDAQMRWRRSRQSTRQKL